MAKRKNDTNSRTYFNILKHVSTKQSQFDYAEVYRHLRTNIEFSNVDKDVKVICFTSTEPNEGKSTTVINLAGIFAAKYQRVLLIDCDLRKAQLHRYLKLSNKVGLSNSLITFSKTKKIDPSCFQTITDSSFVNNLTVLTTGVKIPNPSEMLSSETFKNFIEHLKELFDYIIIDCPPILSVSDAVPVGNVADGTILVVSSVGPTKKEIKSAASMMERNNVNILGTVLTKAEENSSSYGYGYYY